MSRIAYSYCRASSDPKKQKNSIEVQKCVIANFARMHGYDIQDTYVEYESGGNDSREQFNACLERCVKENAIMITLRIDRMSRSLSVFKTIQNHIHLLRFCELGNQEASLLTLSVLLGVAHQERINTSARVKATYKMLKAKNPDQAWGNPRMATDVQPLGEATRIRNASAFNNKIQLICDDFRKAGYCKLSDLALKLNQVGLTTRRGSSFTSKNLQRILSYGS